MTGGIIMKVLAKIKVLFLIFAILFILFGIACVGSKGYIEDFRDDVKKKGVSGLTKVEYLGQKLSYDEFMDKSEKDIDTMAGAIPVCFVMGGVNVVLFVLGEVKAKQLKKNG